MYNRILVPIAQNTNVSLVMGFVENVLNPGGEITLLYVIPSEKLPVSAVITKALRLARVSMI